MSGEHTRGRVKAVIWRHAGKPDTVCLKDESGNELVNWTGFDGNDYSKATTRANAKRLADGWNALLDAELSSPRGEYGKVVRSYRVQRKATEADPFAKKWPDWLKGRVAILGYLEQGFRACAQPSGKTIGSGEWGHYIVEYDDGSLRVQPNKAPVAHPTPDSDVIGRLVGALADPNAVHVNMLRGGIARPSIRQIIHIYGEDALRAEIAALASIPTPDDKP